MSLPAAVSIPFINAPQSSNTALNTFLAANPNIFTRETYGGAENPNFKTPTKYAYNLTIQQQLPDHSRLMVGYVRIPGAASGADVSLIRTISRPP